MQHKRPNRLRQVILVGLLLGLVLATSGCGGSPQSQQQASQSKSQLDSTLKHARDIGVSASSLQPVIHQEQQISSTSAPSNLFDDAPATNYYLNQAKQYQQLLTQLQGIISIATEDATTKAQMSMQNFQLALSKSQSLKTTNIQVFAQEYTSDQNLLSSAQAPNQYYAISNDANNAASALSLLSSSFAQLVTFNNTIKQMRTAHIDVGLMPTQYLDDMSALNTITKTADFSNLNSLINAQYQMAVVNSIQALPFVGNAKIGQFNAQIALLKTYGMNASSYQQLYNADAQQMRNAKSIRDFLAVSGKIDTDMASMQNDLTQGASSYLITELDREANAWGNAHLYHDKFDGNNYILDSAYTMNGIGYWLQRELSWAWQPSDYQAVVTDDNNEFFNFHMLQQDYNDKTPYNQVHATDLQMMQHYPSLQHGTGANGFDGRASHACLQGRQTDQCLLCHHRARRASRAPRLLDGAGSQITRRVQVERSADFALLVSAYSYPLCDPVSLGRLLRPRFLVARRLRPRHPVPALRQRRRRIVRRQRQSRLHQRAGTAGRLGLR